MSGLAVLVFLTGKKKNEMSEDDDWAYVSVQVVRHKHAGQKYNGRLYKRPIVREQLGGNKKLGWTGRETALAHLQCLDPIARVVDHIVALVPFGIIDQLTFMIFHEWLTENQDSNVGALTLGLMKVTNEHSFLKYALSMLGIGTGGSEMEPQM
ncbi:hypothetical protein KEM48_003100 [Puccinia striiformis f. sp. tritici PST-130]|nr:hypothetical protein KEM48_003100 [Puccinia striiformis f. sp. tritici PST-130]